MEAGSWGFDLITLGPSGEGAAASFFIRSIGKNLGKTGAKVGIALTKNSVIEGFKVSNHAWRKSGLGRGATEELITETGTGKFSGNVIKVFNHNGVKVAVDETRQLIMSIRLVKGFKLP